MHIISHPNHHQGSPIDSTLNRGGSPGKSTFCPLLSRFDPPTNATHFQTPMMASLFKNCPATKSLISPPLPLRMSTSTLKRKHQPTYPSPSVRLGQVACSILQKRITLPLPMKTTRLNISVIDACGPSVPIFINPQSTSRCVFMSLCN